MCTVDLISICMSMNNNSIMFQYFKVYARSTNAIWIELKRRYIRSLMEFFLLAILCKKKQQNAISNYVCWITIFIHNNCTSEEKNKLLYMLNLSCRTSKSHTKFHQFKNLPSLSTEHHKTSHICS